MIGPSRGGLPLGQETFQVLLSTAKIQINVYPSISNADASFKLWKSEV